ncbi:coniferyl alcohol acyltransferase [Rhodamnia argentea]|uniref:Coniferyl alcohol acyltransferase n=1 Tax=Rhodamnia argentea TaxID=178133 RepID=A0A8B8N8H3_9MYRT|nr:coniferyl alcohol acyltransferase [Rhodamnia argentea]
MDVEASVQGGLMVNISKKSIVKSIAPSEDPPQVLTLSNLDLLSGRFPVSYFYFYRKPASDDGDFAFIVEALKSSLAATLAHFYPFAGRIVPNPNTGEPEIVCDNTGALVLEADASRDLNRLDFHNLNQFMQGKLVDIQPDFPVQVQVTKYSCGSISLTFSFDHALGDASAFGKFLLSWSEISRNIPISCRPNHSRNLRPRIPPTYHSSLDQAFLKCTLEDILNIPTPNTLLKRLYHVEYESISNLQKLASSDGRSRTKIEAFSAYLWKMMVRAINVELHANCKMGWLVDGRGRMGDGDSDPSPDYIGNVLSLAVGEASIEDLKNGTIADVSSKVHEAISEVTTRSHFLDLIDWIECHRPGLMLSRVVLGQGGPTLVVSSGRRFPVAELDFGFGNPVLGTVCSTIEKIGLSYVNQRSSARGDGSWTVSAILRPELAAAFESDPILQPMSTRHLQL